MQHDCSFVQERSLDKCVESNGGKFLLGILFILCVCVCLGIGGFPPVPSHRVAFVRM